MSTLAELNEEDRYFLSLVSPKDLIKDPTCIVKNSIYLYMQPKAPLKYLARLCYNGNSNTRKVFGYFYPIGSGYRRFPKNIDFLSYLTLRNNVFINHNLYLFSDTSKLVLLKLKHTEIVIPRKIQCNSHEEEWNLDKDEFYI